MPTGQHILEGQGETRKGSKVSYKGNQKVKKIPLGKNNRELNNFKRMVLMTSFKCWVHGTGNKEI